MYNKKNMPTRLAIASAKRAGRQGFTLIELLLSIAILSILSGAILVSISSQRDKARATRMLSEMSAMIQPIYMCLADGGAVWLPNGGGGADICQGESAYGTWPMTADNGFGSYTSNFNTSTSEWFIYTDSGSDTRICCNSHMLGCEELNVTDTCDATQP